MRVRGLAVVGVAVSAVLALAPSAGASATVTLSTPTPRPGLMAATVFRLEFALGRGQRAPHQLAIVPVHRRHLPRGLAVVGTARLVIDSPRGSAVYVGIVAAYRSKTVGSETSRTRTSREGDVFWRLGAVDPQHEAIGVFGESPDRRWTALHGPTTLDFASAPSLLASNETYNDEHASSWGPGRPPEPSIDADAALGSTEESLIDGRLDPGLVGDIEQALDARFVREFPNGSLDGDPSEQGAG